MRLFNKRRRKSSFKSYAARPVLYSNKRPGRRSGIRSFSFDFKKYSKLFVVFCVIAGLVFGVYLLAFSGFFKIKEVVVIKEGVKENESALEFYFNALKDKNILLTSTDEVSAKIRSDFLDIDNLAIKKRLPDTLQVEYSEFDISANLLQDVDGVQRKYLLNSQGVVAKQDIENPSLPYIKMKSGEPLELRTQVVTADKLKYILECKKYFEEKFGLKVFDVVYHREAREVHLNTEKYFAVWVDMTQSYEKQFEKLKKAMAKLDIYNELLKYIDLRIAGTGGEKVIYKR